MDHETIVKTAAVEGAKAAPPVTVVAANVASGWTMTHAATALTILYVLLQAAYLLWRWRNEREDRRARQAEQAARKTPTADPGDGP
ncbi:Uncharacterised protein [Delftia tsuruhatensis]|uniref:hypothetical protein n=1 Tax=Delftia tsuruhatensis TaxID=180282 RepID=UPI001E819309|nr:hypothetical protein [Delftia tsuruhatensis]CAB5719246.1 Uncharacterised protein [Delftia tsuruhatensis]CAC9687807.1 Uncharacterised protein [Delftia tsuruhatensis]